MNSLQIENLKCGYDAALPSKPITLSLPDEKTFGVIGLWGINGSGKSTFLKTLAGLIPPIEGNVFWKKGVRLGYVPQELEYEFHVPVCVKEIIQQLKNPDSDENAIVASLEMSSFLNQPWQELSRGQRQRTLLARALMKSPHALLLDEPFSALDQTMSEKLENTLRECRQRAHVILIDHNRSRLERLSDKIVEFS